MATPNQAGVPNSGTAGRVQANNVNYPLDHWDVEGKADVDDTTTFEDFDAVGGFTYQVDIDGVRRATGTISGYLNYTTFGYLSLYKGALVTNLYLYVDRVGSRFYSFPKARIVSNMTTVDVGNGKIKWAASFKNFGLFTDPI